MGAEERGQGQAIAENLMEMMWLKTPIVSVSWWARAAPAAHWP